MDHVAVAVVLAQVAVIGPVGVVPLDAPLAHQRPVLGHDLALGVVPLEHADALPVVAPRKEVGRDERVGVDALIGHVAVLLPDVTGPHVELHAVAQKGGRIAEGEIVAVVAVVGHHAARIDGTGREIGLVAFGARGEGDALGADDARPEIVLRGLVARTVGRIEAPAPAHGRLGLVRRDVARTVAVLEAGHHEGGQQLRVAGDRHRGLPGEAPLGGDDHGAVRSVAAVERRGSGSRQHRDRLDILGVDVGDRLRAAARLELRVAVAAERIDRHAVDHIEGIRRLVDGLRAAHDHLRGAAHARRRGVDVHARDLAVERVDEVGIADRQQLLGGHLLHVVGQRLLRAFDAERRNDHGVDAHGLLAQLHAQRGTAADGEFHGGIAQIVDRQHSLRRIGDAEREGAIGTGGRTGGRALDDDGRAHDRHAVGIDHLARDDGRPGPLRSGGFMRKDDVRIFDRIADIRRAQQRIERVFERHVDDIDRNPGADIDAPVVHEKVGSLPFDGIEHPLERDVGEAERHRRGLSPHLPRAEQGGEQRCEQKRNRFRRTCTFNHSGW